MSRTTRRHFLKGILATSSAPLIIPASALGLAGAVPPSSRITMGCIGVGGQGTGDMQGFIGFREVQVVAVCDVVESHRDRAKKIVDGRYNSTGCAAYNDFRQIIHRNDIDAVLIGTPDHWHAIISCEAMKNGKDVYCEKPETLTVREGQAMIETARRYSRVFSGGSQRVWGDYNQLHRWTYSGALGDIQEVWVDVGGPSEHCYLPEEPILPGLDWDLWLGPAPYAPFNKARLNFRAWRDYSGGGMTDWGAHGFGGALFACNLHNTGPVEIIPPAHSDNKLLTYVFKNGIRIYHGRGKSGNIIHIKGSKKEVPGPGSERPPEIYIPNYKGNGGIFGDFLYCVRTRQRPFRDIAVAHRTVTVCHLGNLAYWLNRPLKWNPETQEIIGDPEASRCLDRPKRAPWRL
jgi:hypothetical protein